MQLSSRALKVKSSSTLNITAKAKAMRANGIDVVGFGAGEPDFNTPEHVNEAAVIAINNGFTKYTLSSGIEELRSAICEKLKNENGLDYKPNQIVISNGAKHSLTNVFMAILNEGDEVIIPAPYWLSYPQMILMAGGVPVYIYTEEKNNFKVTKNDLEKMLTDKTKAIIINSPCNPTGAVYSKEELETIAEFAVKNDIFVISDEVYEKLLYDDENSFISIASLNEEIYNRTIVVNGLSKSYSMTGWRVGYTASSEEIARVMGNIQSHSTSNSNSIAQKAALAAFLGNQDCVEQMRKEYKLRRDYIYKRICETPNLSAIKPEGAFYVFVNIEKFCGKTIEGKFIKDSNDIAEILLDNYNVAVIPGNDFGFDKYIRLSFAISKENIEKGLDRISKFAVSI